MIESGYKPPFTMSDSIVNLVSSASFELGRASALMGAGHSIRLRRQNRIRTVHSSLAIEHNTLSLGQVTAILDGKRVLGDQREIHEVENAFAAYDLLTSVDPMSVDDLLRVHGVMMAGLVDEAGRFCSGGVGVYDGDVLVHMAPPAKLVPGQIANLFSWYAVSSLHPLVKSAVFHYEFEFIHPFQDGNGRMGRLWHTALLGAWNPVFLWLPVEELIQQSQQGYYDALGEADVRADSSGFVELMLRLFVEALSEAADASENVSIGEAKRDDSGENMTIAEAKRDDSGLVDAMDAARFNSVTRANVLDLHAQLSDAADFGRKDVIAVIGGSDSRAGNLLKKMLDAGIVVAPFPARAKAGTPSRAVEYVAPYAKAFRCKRESRKTPRMSGSLSVGRKIPASWAAFMPNLRMHHMRLA